MSSGRALLLFMDLRDGFDGWLMLGDGAVAARGASLEGLPPLADPASGEAVRVAAIVPGDAVTVHWLEVPGDLAPAQATAAARLIASEVSAQPLGDMHVAVGPEIEGGGRRVVALVPALVMAGWLGRMQAHGLDPDIMLPEPLLLAPPEQGFVRYDRGQLPLWRGPSDAFSIEPELAHLVVGDAPVATLDGAAFEAGLAQAVAAPPVNLRQGAFARRTRWKVEWDVVRRLALLGVGILLATLAIQLAAILRYTYAADAAEAETAVIASRALGGRRVADGPGELERRLDALGGGGAGYTALATALFAAVRDTPNVEVGAMTFDRDGSLRVTVTGDAPAAIASLAQRIEASGLVARSGAAGNAGGRPTAEITVGGR